MKKALVIDDNRKTADALVEMLELLDLDAQPAYGSSVAMGILAEHVPPFILLDINMPGVDGVEILGYLKREPRLVNVPVVVITSDDQAETQQRALDAGADAVLLKPASLAEIEKALKEVGAL